MMVPMLICPILPYSPATMDALGLFRGDTVLARGKKRRDTGKSPLIQADAALARSVATPLEKPLLTQTDTQF